MAKGSKSDPYTMAEYNEMLQNGTWKGGYVKDDNGNVSYTLPELTVNGYSGSGNGSGSSSGIGSGSDFQFGSYKSFQGDPGLDDDEDDDESDDINKNNNMSGEDGKNLGNEHDYYVSGTGGSGSGEKVPNAGETDLNVDQIYTEEEADTLINRGEWPGGYIIGLGYELPVLYINGENKKIFHAHGSDGTPTGYTGDLSTYWVKTFGIPKVYRK